MVVFNVLSCITQYNFQLFWEQVQKFLAHPQHFFHFLYDELKSFFFLSASAKNSAGKESTNSSSKKN